MYPTNQRYAPTHEWARQDGSLIVVGITQYAVDLLTDLVYLDLPDVGENTFAGSSFGEVESVKAVSDLYAPVAGEVVEVNQAVVSDPAVIASDPYGAGWLVKIRPEAGATLDGLLTAEQYQQQIASEAH
ncbi:MAG TPA: glycine cleavage system protein GcvH [Gemmatales bacterium]|nr:glycine cleavage system protein GcvH [Gemmatales bacterium]HMP61453.1 glycine cleavage system protein GcvH [Gemmatales bacterium]